MMAISCNASMQSLHYLVTTVLIPTLTWSSEIWWFGAHQITDFLNPTYLRCGRLISGFPTHPRTFKLLCAAGISPRNLLLDRKSRDYGIRLLLSQNDQPNKRTLKETKPGKEVGLGHIKTVLGELIPPKSRVEDD